jgi:hypothetical protein
MEPPRIDSFSFHPILGIINILIALYKKDQTCANISGHTMDGSLKGGRLFRLRVHPEEPLT